MNPSLKDLDRIIGGLTPELQCGEGVLADVCVWYVAFKKQLKQKMRESDELKARQGFFWNSYNGIFNLAQEILGESKENGESGENKENGDATRVAEDLRDRALDYHKSPFTREEG